jgi:hypothetical protein
MLAQMLKRQEKLRGRKDPIRSAYDALLPITALGSEAAPSVSMSRGSQGYLALKNVVKTHPGAVIEMVQRNMKKLNTGSAENFTLGQAPDALFYVEHRSHITSHIANATWAWHIAAVCNLLAQTPPKIEEALARAYLSLAASEQVSLDSGSWLYAADMAMPDTEVPFTNLARHDPIGSRTPHTPLIDPMWFETVVSRIKALEDTVERKKKHLSASQASTNAYQGRRPLVPKAKSGVPPG